MKLERLEAFFSTSPAARLLRSPNAAPVVCFLQQTFKDSGLIALPHSELVARLGGFQQELRDMGSEGLRDQPESYLTVWCSGDSRWLRRFLDAEHTEALYELSPHSEDVLKFLSEILDRSLGFVGTESRLNRIMETLSDLVIRGSADPQRRLEHLKAERDRLAAEIALIESGGDVATYSPTAIRERFADALSDLGKLQGDFRAVEDSFKSITRDVQKRNAESDGSRGEILGFALDAEDTLKTEDQGVSFYEFVRLVLSPTKQRELEGIVSRLDEIEELAEQLDGMQRIRSMMGSLSDEAEKVLRTTRRLSTTLRRLLDRRTAAGRQRLAEVLRDIRAAGVELAEHPTTDRFGLEVETELGLSCPFERSFWRAPAQFEMPELNNGTPDEDNRLQAFRNLAAMQRLDWSGMRRTVTAKLRERDRVPLVELLAEHPPKSGAIEVLGYVQIAHDDGHEVDPNLTETVLLPATFDDDLSWTPDHDQFQAYEVPRVTYLSRRLRVAASRREAAADKASATDRGDTTKAKGDAATVRGDTATAQRGTASVEERGAPANPNGH